MPKATTTVIKPEVDVSPALSLFARPGSIATRHIAILVASGVDGEAARAIHAGLSELGAVPRYVGPRLGAVETEQGDTLEVEVTLEAMPSVLFDALAIPGGDGALTVLGKVGHALEFIKDQYRHAKPILALGEGPTLVETAGVPATLPSGNEDPGLVLGFEDAADALPNFVKAISLHRHPRA